MGITMQFDVTTGASSVSVYMQNMELILQFMELWYSTDSGSNGLKLRYDYIFHHIANCNISISVQEIFVLRSEKLPGDSY
jgi:hypothetical protein